MIISKHNIVHSTFKIEVTNTDSNLKLPPNKVLVYEMARKNIHIPIHVNENDHQPYVYIKFVMLEDQTVLEEEG